MQGATSRPEVAGTDRLEVDRTGSRAQNSAVKRKRAEVALATDLEAAVTESCSNLNARASAPARYERNDLGIYICGPAKAARSLLLQGEDVEVWLEKARVAAIAGSCPRSHKELKSSVRAYCIFATKVKRLALPPTVELLLAWSNLFRCKATFQNYVSHVRTACQLVGCNIDQTYDSVLRKAMRAIDKRRGYVPRPPMWIGMDLVKRLVVCGSSSSSPKTVAITMAFLTTYVFMLRMPSECLPIRVARGDASDHGHQAVITISSVELVLKLRRRKNKEGGSLLVRKCWCRTCTATCPVHVLGPFFRAHVPGASPFAEFDARRALAVLRGWLQAINVPEWSKYRTHDLRRGHARDMLRNGARLCEILRAGEWKSAAFLAYLDGTELECDATLEAHVLESSDEEEER